MKALTRLGQRRYPVLGGYTIEQARELAALSRSLGRQVGLTIDRQGKTMTVDVTWDSVPQDEQATTQEQSAAQPNQGYTDPYDLFDYFFGNGGYSGSSARSAA